MQFKYLDQNYAKISINVIGDRRRAEEKRGLAPKLAGKSTNFDKTGTRRRRIWSRKTDNWQLEARDNAIGNRFVGENWPQEHDKGMERNVWLREGGGTRTQ